MAECSGIDDSEVRVSELEKNEMQHCTGDLRQHNEAKKEMY